MFALAWLLLTTLVAIATHTRLTHAIQSNRTCAPKPKDVRQSVCQCSRSLQLRCFFNPEILLMETKFLEESLRPIFYDDVQLDRLADPEDQLDPNANFALNRLNFAGKKNKFYLYFPNFDLMSMPYVRITMSRFNYVPAFAFGNANAGTTRQIESIVFETPNAYDFGIDEAAFSGVEITDTLLFEGPFNQINVHANAFRYIMRSAFVIHRYGVLCSSEI